MTNYLSLSIKEIHELFKNKTIKPIDLVEEAISKIKSNDHNAFITTNFEEARKLANKLADKEVKGLLFGIPVAIKDNIATKDILTTCASKMLSDFTPTYDATVVTKLKEENAIIIGKTNMDEFAMGSTGETSYYKHSINPLNKLKVTGGSSSGSASCVASNSVSLALGTDTGGSIRQPASFCGIVGLKPTYSRVSRYGVISFASSLDCVGPMTSNVHDNAIMLNVISGADKNDLTCSTEEVKDYTKYLNTDVSNMKVCVPNYYMSDVIDAEVRNKIKEVISMLQDSGIVVDYIDIPYLDKAISLYQIIALSEASSNLARYDGIKYGHLTDNYNSIDELYSKSRSEGFGNEVKRRIMIGSYVLSGENADKYYFHALKVRDALTKSMKSVFENYDLIIGPTNTNVAYDLNTKLDDALKSFYDDLLTIPVNMAGLPAMSLPVGFNSENLAIGMHLIANSFMEENIYKLASYIEKQLKGGK